MGHGTMAVKHLEFQLVDQRNQDSNPGGECTNLFIETWAMSFSPCCQCLFEDIIIHTQHSHRSQEEQLDVSSGKCIWKCHGVLLRCLLATNRVACF